MPDSWPLLSLLLLSPGLGILVLLFVPSRHQRLLRIVGVSATLLPLLLAGWLYALFESGSGGLTELAVWAELPLNRETINPQFAASYVLQLHYHLAVDGLSLPLVLLTVLVSTMAALAAVHVVKRRKAFYIWFLVLELAMLGVFLARDLVLFFLFFELTLIAAFFLIGIWGYQRREKTAVQFLIYNGIGSALMLLAFLILISTAGIRVEPGDLGAALIYSGSYDQLLANLADPQGFANQLPQEMGGYNPFYLSDGLAGAVFVLLLVGFGIKLPIFPLHTWMVRVHAEAHPSVVMLHAGVLLKMGAYGLLRFGIGLLPAQAEAWGPALAVLGAISMLYGAVLALVQRDLKRVLAYSSVSHMGLVLLGFATLRDIGLQGAVFLLISHGLIAALLFLLVGSLYERTHTTELDRLGGLARELPFMCGILLVAGLALLGLPGLSGFVGEFLVLLGLFETMPWIAAVAGLGLVITAAYVLRAVLAVAYGEPREPYGALRDARLVEAAPMVVLLSFIVLLGIYPSLLTGSLQDGAVQLLRQLAAVGRG
ncbi:NADH-quinone oxidoreductase subunit M [Paenibacillus sp. IB182496]|uniref:NADH-quinone oxidoreductase subunit M n=1 Tax=Paenibacillus sabuli TaxID=2772509 RepID=A0A927BUS9_9BACL|nr:NADH-quinone oxidoreductase subunit M [Paenibacillus sabuli]MBD2845874.1 NADH-quinone oxidoreductase subunit M [Paenibacillus sabuli]